MRGLLLLTVALAACESATEAVVRWPGGGPGSGPCAERCWTYCGPDRIAYLDAECEATCRADGGGSPRC